MSLFRGDHDRKAELIRRAIEHREQDRLIQQYGFFEPMDAEQAHAYSQPEMDGDKNDWREGDWAGCAVGCLAAPVLSQEDYRTLWRRGDFKPLSFESAAGILQDEFGIPRALTVMAEFVFEGLPKDEAAEWPEQFARALPVGAALDDGMIEDWILNAKSGEIRWTASDAITMRYDDVAFPEARDQLLAFLRSLPTPRPYGGVVAA